jgi:hypothetical protein
VIGIKYVLLGGLILSLLLASALMVRISDPSNLYKALALISAVMIVSDTVKFIYAYESIPGVQPKGGFLRSAGADLPNIYHIIFDEYQTDMFELSMSDELTHTLSGFTLFADATTPFGRTDMALPAIFTGRDYQYDQPQIDYQLDAFASQQSLLWHLQDLGYSTEAYLHRVYEFEPELFDRVEYHRGILEIENTRLKQTFFDLWAYAVLPGRIALKLIGETQYQQFEFQNVLNPIAPVKSVRTVRTITAFETTQAARGRYVFAHLILPHFPYVLDRNCVTDSQVRNTSPAEQSACANLLMSEIVAELKRLGRYKDSIIVFQSDHGARFSVVDGRLEGVEHLGRFSPEWSTARSRPLLLVKPAGASEEPLRISQFPASLTDIAPTLAGVLGVDMQAEGLDLFNTENTERERFYHFYDKEGPNGWTTRLTRFRISPGSMTDAKEIPLLNNPKET